ncbi:hypothetical protein [Staphylococcus canis]|uniref:Uncharacterized protein n=1 Tax=Staphylococcus canis TaxID=2724942 RepID=A0ABS0TAA7_9STAP|nr:hypothetical protein [Staphylococcus canis]MBI5975683.1 hypothetical protein [Staphylococcus canis]
MFRDMAFYMFGTELDTFIQYFVFELLIIVLIGTIVGILTKKLWIALLVIIGLNVIDIGILANFNASQGNGTFLGQFFLFLLAKFFPTFYEILFTTLLLNVPFFRRAFKLG